LYRRALGEFPVRGIDAVLRPLTEDGVRAPVRVTAIWRHRALPAGSHSTPVAGG